MWTLCSLGSNVEPEHNIPLAIDRLARWFSLLQVSPLIHTAPVGLMGGGDFINGLVRFQTNLSDGELKQRLNALEIDLGRDRHHPDKKRLPRTIDVDILDRRRALKDLVPGENTPYMRDMWAADQGVFKGLTLWPVRLDQQLLGQETAAVHFDHRTGQVRVSAEQIERIQNRLKPALALQERVG